MKGRSVFLGLFLGLILSSCSGPSLHHASNGINAYPALWQVKNNNSNVYFFGSVHALPPQVRWYSIEIKQAFKAADIIIFESVSNETVKEIKVNGEFSEARGTLPHNKKISDYLSTEENKKYMEIAKAFRIKPEKAQVMKPWFFTWIVRSLLLRRAFEFGVDNLLQREAVRTGKILEPLESAQQAITSLSEDPLAVQIKELKKMLAEPAKTKVENKSNNLLLAWVNGSTENIAKQIKQQMTASQYQNLIVKRNKKWLPKIKNYLSSGKNVLIVVGQAHLVGGDSVLSMLRRLGYKVTRVQ